MSKEDIHAAAVALGRKGGSVTSEAKARAARENGKKGGRPKEEERHDEDINNRHPPVRDRRRRPA